MEIPNVSYCENDNIVKYSSDEILMTTETNPKVLAICYRNGWCANNRYMTFEEAAKITDIGTAFKQTNITHFEEFKYFSGITSIGDNAFLRCGNLTTITIPTSVISIGNNALMYLTSLNTIMSLPTTAPSVLYTTFWVAKPNGILYVPKGAVGYEVWMQNSYYFLGNYNWTKQEI